MKFDKIEKAIDAIANGEMIVVVDDDDRENEGDLIIAASKATPEKTGFIIRHTSGILCVSVPQEYARRLHLDPMVSDNDAPLGTAFTISVDLKEGLTTGISALERANTIRAMAHNKTKPTDFVRPGHVFPLIAKEGGVLMRSGHTEAASDLASLAGLEPVGLLSELMNDDGSVKRGDEVFKFAKKNNLRIISVADIIQYREKREQLVKKVAEKDVSTSIGKAKVITYNTIFDDVEHIALIYGDIASGENIPTRIHRENIIKDVFQENNLISGSLAYLKKKDKGVILYLREGAVGVQGAGNKSLSENRREEQWRDIGLGAQILRDLNISSIDLLSSTTSHFVGLSGFGIEINSRLPLNK
tara:strand:- start:2561 stop:3634 length:1074 start_codon:yes stop_codon:yes gene_type:complete